MQQTPLCTTYVQPVGHSGMVDFQTRPKSQTVIISGITDLFYLTRP